MLLCINDVKLYFNTSNVTIQRHCSLNAVCVVPYFNTSNVTIQPLFLQTKYQGICISIHLMLLFNFLHPGTPEYNYHISIHLMLLFNLLFYRFHNIVVLISIHLMLLFNKYLVLQATCYQNFNTSNVTIQRI